MRSGPRAPWRFSAQADKVQQMQVRIALAAMAWLAAEVDDDYRRHFTGTLMRVDYFHTGTASKERFSLDRIRVEGPWPGNPRRLLDSTGLGKYRFQLVDPDSDRVLFSEGFSSIYGEWETTGEARQEIWRTFPEAVCFPEPRRTVRLEMYKRNRRQAFQPVWDLLIDPGSDEIDRSQTRSVDRTTLMRNGPSSDKVDLLFLGDGYPEEDKFKRDARRLFEALFRLEPFASRRTDFNVRGLFTPAIAEGVSRPGAGVFRSSPLGASYDALGLKRYILTTDDRAWRDAAASAPSDFVVILVNDEEYGGGGIFNLYAAVAADSSFSSHLLVHEFGHLFAGLGDEYYTSAVAYLDLMAPGVEPWEPNLTALLDPARLKWGHLVQEGTPLPTPWDKPGHERTSPGDGENSAVEPRVLEKERYAGVVGAFEGASYTSEGLYRPALTCVMFSRKEPEFCPVCREAIERMIDFHVK